MWAVKVLLALVLVFSGLFLAKFLGVSFFTLNHRSMDQLFLSNVLVSEGLDFVVWGVAAGLVVTWLFFWFIFKSGRGAFSCFMGFCSVCFIRVGGFWGVWCFAFGFGEFGACCFVCWFFAELFWCFVVFVFEEFGCWVCFGFCVCGGGWFGFV